MNNGKTVVYKGKEYSNYTVTTDGRIFNAKTEKELKQVYVGRNKDSRRHDLAINLCENGKRITVKVALLVLETYKGRPAPLTNTHSGLSWSVNHIDENVYNNDISNLEWLTVVDNAKAYWANRRAR